MRRRTAGRPRRTALAQVVWCLTIVSAPCAVRSEPQAELHALAIDATIAASDYAPQTTSGSDAARVNLTVIPRLESSWRGSGLEVDVRAEVAAQVEAPSTSSSRRQPWSLDLEGSFKVKPAESLLTLDGGVRARTTSADAYDPNFDDTISTERRTETLLRLSPQFAVPLEGDRVLLARSDLTRVANGSGSGAGRIAHHTLARYEQLPVPLGYSFEIARVDSDSPDLDNASYNLTSARASASLLIGEGLHTSMTLGRDEGGSDRGDISRGLVGIGLRWRPGARTALDASIERRFFGTSFDVAVRHRMPWLALSARLSRKAAETPAGFEAAPNTAALPALLDAMLTTRVDDSATRREEVSGMLIDRALEPRAREATEQVASYPQLQTQFEVGAALIGRRSAMSLNLYAQSSRALQIGQPLQTREITADSRQRGGTLQLSHRMTPQLTALASMHWTHISGLGARAGDTSKQRSVRFLLQQQLSPRTSAHAGTEWRRFETSVAGLRGFDARRIFVGISHRF